ncbi:MAG: hypothetical protein GQ583_11375 [Methyloprofundus sp.]|nr:hypothetical protein [Methyloprofundus sp.]
MLQKLARFIKRISSVPVLVALILISVLFPALLFPAHGLGDIRLLDLYFSYSPEQVYENLARLGEEGRSAYTCMALTSDLVFPVIYSLALSVALMLTLKKLFPPTSRFLFLCLFPFLIVIADWCENLSLAFVTRVFPEPADLVVSSASFFTSLKWSLVVLTLLMLLMAVVIRIISDIGES